jgi:hypothetical protein
VLGWLKRLFSSREGPEVEYRHPDTETPPVMPAGPPSAPFPPAVPLDTPDVPEEPDRQP